jgi:lysozyme family protein
MDDPKGRAYAVERRYRMLTTPWSELMSEIRAERGSLLATTEYREEWAGVEKAERLNIIDTRLKTVEDWLTYYRIERKNGQGFRVRRWLATASKLSDAELEGVL